MGKVIHIISDQNITVNYDGETHIVPRIDALAEKLIQALREGKADEIPGLVSAAKRIEKFDIMSFICDKEGKLDHPIIFTVTGCFRVETNN